MADWKKTASTSGVPYTIGDGLLITAGILAANPGVGLDIDGGGFLVVNPGTGLGISGSQVVIPAGAITSALLAALSVGTAQLQNSSVTGTQIAAASITTAHIGAAQITTALIANAAITNALLGTAVVGTANIQNGAITNALIGTAVISSANIGTLTALTVTAPNFTSTSGSDVLTLTGAALNCHDGLFVTATLMAGVLTLSKVASSQSASLAYNGGGWNNSSGGTLIDAVGFNLTVSSAICDITATALNLTNIPFQINSSTVIDASANGTLASLKVNGLIQFAGTNSTGTGAALLGTNCPAGGSLSAPNTWMEVTNAAGIMGWIPMWV